MSIHLKGNEGAIVNLPCFAIMLVSNVAEAAISDGLNLKSKLELKSAMTRYTLNHCNISIPQIYHNTIPNNAT